MRRGEVEKKMEGEGRWRGKYEEREGREGDVRRGAADRNMRDGRAERRM